MRVLLFVISASLLSACSNPTIVIGQTRDSVATESVKVFYYQYPSCNFETIAHIQVYGYYSLSLMLQNMRREAAELGANGLYLQHTQQLGIKEFLGTAKAIHCSSA